MLVYSCVVEVIYSGRVGAVCHRIHVSMSDFSHENSILPLPADINLPPSFNRFLVLVFFSHRVNCVQLPPGTVFYTLPFQYLTLPTKLVTYREAHYILVLKDFQPISIFFF